MYQPKHDESYEERLRDKLSSTILGEDADEDVEESPFQRETDDYTMSHIETQSKKSFFERNFSEIEKGGMRSSLFTMFTGTVGAGLLSLPRVFGEFGAVWGVLNIVLFSIVNYYTIYVLNSLIVKSGKKSYANIAAYYLGKVPAKIVTQFLIVAMCSTAIIYGAVSWQFFCTLLKNLGLVDFPYGPGEEEIEKKMIDQSASFTTTWRYGFALTSALFIIPFAYQRTLGALRYFSVLVFSCMIYTIVVSVAEAPFYRSEFKDHSQYSLSWFESPQLTWFRGMGTFMLAFTNQVFFFYVRGEMMHKTDRRVNKLNYSLHTIVCFVFLAICVSGYLSLGKELLPELYTLRISRSNTGDYFMRFAQVFFTIAAFFKVAILLFPSREQLYIFYKINRGFRNHIIITAIGCFVAFGVPCVYPDVTNLLGIIGGICAGTTGFSFPMFLKLASLKKEGNLLSASGFFHVLLLLALFTIQVMSTYVSLTTKGSGH